MNKYIIKFKNSRAYIKEINGDKHLYTFDINKAQILNKEESKKIKLNNELEVVEYKKERYEAAEEKYKIFVKILSEEESNQILNKDLENLKDIENEKFYLDLQLKYPDNKILQEASRLIYLIENSNYNDKNKKQYDYDYKAQLKILDETFFDKYIDKNSIEDEEEL